MVPWTHLQIRHSKTARQGQGKLSRFVRWSMKNSTDSLRSHPKEKTLSNPNLILQLPRHRPKEQKASDAKKAVDTADLVN